MKNPEYVWMIEERVRAEVISLGAHVSVVKYRTDEKTHVITAVTNDEFDFMEEDIDDTD